MNNTQQIDIDRSDVDLAKVLRQKAVLEPSEMLKDGRLEPFRIALLYGLVIIAPMASAMLYSVAQWLYAWWIVGSIALLLAALLLLITAITAVIIQIIVWRRYLGRQAAVHEEHLSYLRNLFPVEKTVEKDGYLSASNYQDVALFITVYYLQNNDDIRSARGFEGPLYLGKRNAFKVGDISRAQAQKMLQIVENLKTKDWEEAQHKLIAQWPKIIANKR